MATRILLADDLSFMRMVQKEILEEKGYDVVGEASDGLEAIEKYKSLRPDILILDITMPNMNGLDAMHKIFELDKQAKIIMCSALGQQQLIVEAIKSGVKDFIVKPFKPERILSAIEKAMR
ncbi:MAG: two-component system response regulator [Spirochaetes bacterium GWD1_27_9]|nr:MAG: two-component system response regulator [Spirochaetes bacterium GWB1_27_13]OHD26081.1 MAG: two-component system response regulator [Spirochaetes bacterium GWC1_27_15]OHD41248.1 MAG: two-component system response regulator [Spirochaetes bacterium GWD1_27_9]